MPSYSRDSRDSLSSQTVFRHRLLNLVQTILYFFLIVLIMSSLSYILAGVEGFYLSLITVGVFFILGAGVSPNIVLGLTKAQPISGQMAPGLYTLVEVLAQRAGLRSRIRLFYFPELAMNALSTGSKRKPCIALSEGLLSRLDRREMIGVIAHEIAHISHGDLRILVVSQLIGRVVSFFSLFIQLIILFNLPFILTGVVKIPIWFIFVAGIAPVLLHLLQMKLSRIREYAADLTAIRLTGDPEGLAKALGKIGSSHRNLFHLFFPRRPRSEAPEWLRTHPPVEERIRRILSFRNEFAELDSLPLQESEFWGAEGLTGLEGLEWFRRSRKMRRRFWSRF